MAAKTVEATAAETAQVDTVTEKAEQTAKETKSDKGPARKSKAADPRRKVKIRLQRPFNTKTKGQTISVNNYRFFIPYGKTVEVPFFIAEIARMSSEQDEKTAEMIDSMADKAPS